MPDHELDGGPGGDRRLSVRGHLEALERHAAGLCLDYVLVDPGTVDDDDAARAARELFGAELVVRPIAGRTRTQHDTLRLAAAYRDICYDANVLTEESW